MRTTRTILTFLAPALAAACLLSCSVRELREDCYDDPRLRLSQSEIVLDMDDGPVLVSVTTLNPSGFLFDISDTTLFRVERAGDSTLMFTPLRPGGPGTLTLTQEEFIPDDGDDWYRYASASIKVTVVDTVQTVLSVGRLSSPLDEGEQRTVNLVSNNGAPFHVESTAPLIAKVTKDSLLTGMLMGRTTLTWIQQEWTDKNFVTYLPARDSITVDVVSVPRLSGAVNVVQGKSDTLGVSDPSHLGWAIETDGMLEGVTFSYLSDFETRAVKVSADRNAGTGSIKLRLRRLDKDVWCDSTTVTVSAREMDKPRFSSELYRFYVQKGAAEDKIASPCILDPDMQGWTLVCHDGIAADVSAGTGDSDVVFSVPAVVDYEHPYSVRLYSSDGRTLYAETHVAIVTQAWLEDNSPLTLKAGESALLKVLDPSRHGWGTDTYVDGYQLNAGRFTPEGVSIYLCGDDGYWFKGGVVSSKTFGNGYVKILTEPDTPPCGFTLIIYDEGDGKNNGWPGAQVHISIVQP